MSIKDKFSKLDQSKKWVICFVCISFIGIISVTVFNAYHGTRQNDEDKIIARQSNADRKKEKDKKQKFNETQQGIATDNEPISDKKTEVDSNADKKRSVNNDIPSGINASTDNSSNNSHSIPQQEMVNAYISIYGLNKEIIATGTISIEKGKSVYHGLQLFTTNHGIGLTTTGPGKYVYVTSINGLYEKQHGASSGWLYRVNGIHPNLGAGHVQINENDQIEWYYTHD